MANRLEISDEEWNVIQPVLVAHAHIRVVSETACRDFLAAVLWVLRSGAQWRLLPAEHGKWNPVFKRFSRWCRHGDWGALHAACAHRPDLQSVLIDSTVVRTHPCTAGAAGSNAEAEALGRSRGGFGTKVHAITGALGNPLDFVLTGGQAIEAREMEAVIPPRSNRHGKREVDWFVYKECHLIECFFNKIKHYRRIFARYEKTARNYTGFPRFVSALIWLR